MAYRKLRTLGDYISMTRIRDRWPTKDLDRCISRLSAPGIGASLGSFSLTLVDVDLEEGGLVGPIPIVALVVKVCDLAGIVPPPIVLPREFPVTTISVFLLSEVP
jgi:hypothetical protein